jgi:hypothetical protein
MRSARLLLAACSVLAAGALAGCKTDGCRDADACRPAAGERASLQHASAEKAAPDCLLACNAEDASWLRPVTIESIGSEPTHVVAHADEPACADACSDAKVAAKDCERSCDTACRVACDDAPRHEANADPLPSYAVGRTDDAGPRRSDWHRNRQSRNNRFRYPL